MASNNSHSGRGMPPSSQPAQTGWNSNNNRSSSGGNSSGSSNSANNNSSNKNQQPPPPGSTASGSSSQLLLHKYPVNSLLEIQLNTGETISGRVYCTDEMTGSVVLQTALVHTTLATEIRIIAVDSIVTSTTLPETTASVSVAATPLTQPLPKIHKKALEDRERRAIRLAEDSLRHINQKATALGQAVFDRLLKACGEVVWAPGDSASIIVLNQIQVDPPYEPENCTIIPKSITNSNNSSNGRGKQATGALEDSSLDRVRKIVAAATTAAPSSATSSSSSKT